MIQIKSQSGTNQYDENGTPITQWDSKKCAWIVLPEFENERIDWYGKDSDFPAGSTLAEYERNNPDWDKKPNVCVTWWYNTLNSLVKGFGERYWWEQNRKFKEDKNTLVQPEVIFREWGYMDIPKDETVKFFGNHFKHSDRVLVKYNDEVLFDGKLN